VPEGHTLHRLAHTLTDRFAGRTVAVSSPQGRFAEAAALIDGTPLVEAEAWGKHLFVRFDGERFVHVHLGLYGKFLIGDGEAPPPVGQVRLRLAGEQAYADLRGATTCALITAGQRDAVVAKLGPDPLREDADPERAWARISRSRSPIAGLLMNQEILAGVGNVYRAEILFRHGVSPFRPGRGVDEGQWAGMWSDLVTLMRAGVRLGRIVTTRPEHRTRRRGTVQRADAHYVYRRTGFPCRICGTEVRTEVMVGRNLFWCPDCQSA
jgi:endonuclease VIII